MPVHAHASDPPLAHKAAAGFGKLVAQGLLTADEAIAAFGDIAPSTRTRIAWTIHDNARWWRLRQDRAEREIRTDTAALIAALAPRAAAERAALETNRRLGSPLMRADVLVIVDRLLRAALRRMNLDG